MNSDISYWLAEVQSLQQQLSQARQQRDEAHEDANNWRQRYETEASQRRMDTQIFRAEIQQLKETIAQFKEGTNLNSVEGSLEVFPEALIPAGADLNDLQQRIRSLWHDRDRCQQALQQERRAHEQTRQSLTLALGDAVDQLSKYRS
jgi:chromosome segregation ATPase